MPTRNVNLTDHYHQLVEELVESGTYKNASEVLRAGLRLLEHQTRSEEQKLAVLKQLARKGFETLDQGTGLSISGDEQLAETIARIGRRAAKTASRRSAR